MFNYSDEQDTHHILIINNLYSEQEIISLTNSFFSIGRYNSNSLVIKSSAISRFHATIFPLKSLDSDNLSYWIVDGNLEQGVRSTNGLLVNRRKVLMYKLEAGDIIFLPGNIEIIYQKTREQQIDNTTNMILQLTDEIGSNENKPTLSELENDLASLNNPTLLRLATFTELNPFPIIEINTQLQVTYSNSAAREIFGDFLNNPTNSILHNMIGLWNGPQNHSTTKEFVYKSQVFEQHMYKLTNHQVIRSYILNITNRKQSEIMLEYTAYHDELTGLFNRRYLLQKLEELLIEFRNADRNSLAILFLDLDRFKNINDTLGHDFGDLLLQSFAMRLQQSIRSDDWVARWGGDEFIICMKNRDDLNNIAQAAQRIINNLQQPFTISNRRFHIKVSIGISIYPQDGSDRETLIKHADSALYRSKEQGRARYQFYTTTMTSKASTYLKLENLLHQALEDQELLLYYQPQINVETNQVSSMEALIRWQQPELGLINPSDFIPLAEDTGLIIQIGEWVLATACRQNKIWHESGFDNLSISVNVNYQQLAQPNFIEMVSRVFAQTQMQPQYLEIEITESVLLKDIDLVDSVIKEMQNMGINLALDDFGIGYSSLNYLKKILFNTLKLDKSFIDNIIDERSRDYGIVSTMALLAQKLNLKVVAEGVESQQQLDSLMNIFQDTNSLYVQGYFYSRPLKVEKATEFLYDYNQNLG